LSSSLSVFFLSVADITFVAARERITVMERNFLIEDILAAIRMMNTILYVLALSAFEC
jgi:hypothetical protein